MNSEIARMLFYMAVHYGESGEIDLELNNQVSSCTNPYHGKLAVLLEWNEQDPADTFERKEIEMKSFIINITIIDNRNPFIDHPELALATCHD